MATPAPNLLSQQFILNVYLPAAALIAGSLAFRIQLLPIAIAISAILGGMTYINSTKSKYTKVLDPDTFYDFPISKKDQISHNTAIYRFALPSEDSILGLPIGQHISLAAELDVTDPKTGKVEHKLVQRSYTPISSDVEPGFFDLLVKAYPTGNISRHLATLNVGDKMKVRGPKGAMVYTPNMVSHFGMIAGGTGITPMLQIIKAVLRGRASGDRTKIDLIFANVNEEDILLRDQLESLSKQDADFNVYYVLNNPPAGWTGGVGFVTADMLKERLPAAKPDVKILLCGPPPMVNALKKATEGLGFEKARPVSKLEDQVFAF